MDGYATDSTLVWYNKDFKSTSTNSPGKSENDTSNNRTKNAHKRSLNVGHKYKKKKLQQHENSGTKSARIKLVVCEHCNQFFPNEESVCEHLFEVIKKFDSCTEEKLALTKNIKQYNVNVKEKRNPVKIPVVILEKCDGVKESKYYFNTLYSSNYNKVLQDEVNKDSVTMEPNLKHLIGTQRNPKWISSFGSFSPLNSQKTTLNAQLEDHISTPLQKTSLNAQLEDHISTSLQKTSLNAELEDHISTPLQKTSLNAQLEDHISTPLQKTSLNAELEDHISTPLQKTSLNAQLEDHISTPLQKTSLNAELEDHISTPLRKTSLNAQLEDHISTPLQKTSLNAQLSTPHEENGGYNETSMTRQDKTFDTTEIDTISQISKNSSRYDLKTVFVCHICNVSFNTMSTLKYHMQSHEINKNIVKIKNLPLSSDMCDQSSQHRRNPGPRVPRGGTTGTYRRDDDDEYYLSKYKPYGKYLYKCSMCSIHFMKPQHLQSHVASGQHRVNTGFCCDICKLLFDSRSRLSIHKRYHHNIHKYSKEDFIIINSYSNSQAAKDKQIKKGSAKIDPYVFCKRIVKGPKKNLYVCRTCEICFVTPIALKSHLLKNDHDIPRVICHICGYEFDISSLLDHFRIHHKILKMQRENFVIKYSVPSRSDRQHLQNDSKDNEGANDKNSANANKKMHLYKCKHCNVFYIKMKTDEKPNKERCNNCKRILNVREIANDTELESGKLTKLPLEDLSNNRTTPLSEDFLTSTDDDDNCIEEDCSEIKLCKCAECDVHKGRNKINHRKSTQELGRENEVTNLANNTNKLNDDQIRLSDKLESNIDKDVRGVLEETLENNFVNGETSSQVDGINHTSEEVAENINNNNENISESGEQIFSSSIYTKTSKPSLQKCIKCGKYILTALKETSKDRNVECNKCKVTSENTNTTEIVPYINEISMNDDSAIDKTIHSVCVISNNVDIVRSNNEIVVFKESNIKCQHSIKINGTRNSVFKNSNLAEQTNSDLCACTKNSIQKSHHSKKPERIALNNNLDDILNKSICSTETVESTSSIVENERILQNFNLNSETEHYAIANDLIDTEPNFELETVSEQAYSSKANEDNIEKHNKPIINENDVYIIVSDDDFDVDESRNVIEIDSDCEIEYSDIKEETQGISKEMPHTAPNIVNASEDDEMKSEKHYNRKQNNINEQSEKSHIEIIKMYSDEDIKKETKVVNSDSVDNEYQMDVRNSDNGTYLVRNIRVEVEQEDSWDSKSVKSEKMS